MQSHSDAIDGAQSSPLQGALFSLKQNKGGRPRLSAEVIARRTALRMLRLTLREKNILQSCFWRERRHAIKAECRYDLIYRVFYKKESTRLRAQQRRDAIDARKVARAKRRADGLAFWQKNMRRSEQKKQMKREYEEMIAAWREKWKHLLSPAKRKRLSLVKKRRMARIRKARVDGVSVNQLVRKIQNRPVSCFWCNRLLPHGGTVDHVTPIAKGGLHCVSNIVPACHECNSEKSDKSPREFGVLL